jgi:exosortase/archaeosortase family protein
LPFKAAEVVGQSIFLNSIKINFIDACIAGSAYYLLLVLNLSTPSIKRRIYYLVFSFLIFFVINTARILFLIFVLSSVPKYFGLAHMTLWYLASTFIVVGIWFLQVKLFDIKEIPFYSDIRYLLKLI